MSLPPEDTDLSTNSAHEYALQIGSNVSAVRVVGSAVGQRFSPSPKAHPNVIEIPSWENSPVAPSRSEEAAPNAAAAQLLWAENQGLATSHLLPTEPTFETLNTNAYSSPPGDSRFTFPNQNYSPLLPRCVPVPNQRYSPSGSPIHQLHELQNCPLIDSPLRLPFPSPKEVRTPSINRLVDALIDLDQNQQVIYYIQQYNNEPVLYQENIGSGFHVYYQAPEDNQPIVLHIVEHNPQIITESQEQTNQIVPEIQINNIQEQDQKLENGTPERNHPIVTEAQDQNQQTLTEIPEKCLQLASPVITDIQVQSPQDVIGIQEQNHQSVTKIQEEVHQTAPEIQVKIFEISSDIQEQNRQFVTEEQNHQTITEIQEDYPIVSEIQWENLPNPAEIQEQDQDNIVTEVTKLASPVVTDIHVQSPQCVIEIDDEDDEDLKFASGDQEQHLYTISEIHEKIQQSPQFIANEFSEKILHLAPDIPEHNQQTAELQKEGLQFDSEIEKRDLQIVTDTHKQNHQNVTEIQEESRQHQNFVVEGATPLPHAEAQPGPTPEDISDSVSLEHGEPIESFNLNTICIRNTFQLIREISDSLVADPEQPEAANHRLSLYLLRKKLADVSHKVLTEAIHGRASDQCIIILREILEQTKELRPRPQRPTKDTEFQKEISMGLEILKKIRGMLSGWYTSRESETDSRETGTGFQAQNGKGRGAGRQPENSYLSQKRRNQEENPRLVKYRRVDNSFPRLITNETAEDLIPNNSMAERDKPQSSKRLSIFNPPVYTQHRVRNEAPYIPTPFDDEESSQRFANAGPSSRPMTYSDAVRLGQNGIAESRVNGHSSHSVRSASARVQGSILLHEMKRKNQEQYTDLIRTAAQSNSMGSRCVKPGTPPTFQRAKAHETPQPQPKPQPPTRLTKIGSLQQRFANCVFLRDDFEENFKARAIRRQGASMHLLDIAEKQANVSTDERIAYEKKLREIMFRSGTPHRPFFEIGPLDQPDEKNETKLIPLTQEQYVRFRELTTSPITKNVIFKYNLQITTDDTFHVC
ncbi:GM22759 [Drosophila sechellia]|uniref:GM22759 n=1 Tax=Drosophila sechellia TaxID=7238 RepID=B4I725_DROSE|nr:GM22759 [Drosophila sechellia]